MSSYTNKRNEEKGSRNLEPTAEQRAKEQAAREAHRAKLDAEPHYAVEIAHNTTSFWRLSQIQQDPRKFCRQAGLTYHEKTGLNTPQIQEYLAQNCRKPTSPQ